MAKTPFVDMAAHLDTSIASLTSATNLFLGKPSGYGARAPQKSVFVIPTGGPESLAFGAATSVSGQHEPTMQIYIRGEKGDLQTALELAWEILTLLRFAAPSGYDECKVTQGAPYDLGVDKDGLPALTVNCRLYYDE